MTLEVIYVAGGRHRRAGGSGGAGTCNLFQVGREESHVTLIVRFSSKGFSGTTTSKKKIGSAEVCGGNIPKIVMLVFTAGYS